MRKIILETISTQKWKLTVGATTLNLSAREVTELTSLLSGLRIWGFTMEDYRSHIKMAKRCGKRLNSLNNERDAGDIEDEEFLELFGDLEERMEWHNSMATRLAFAID